MKPALPTTFSYPTRVEFGPGALARLAPAVKEMGTRVLVVTDRGLAESPILKKVLDTLTRARLQAEVFSDFDPNPVEDAVIRGVKAFRASKAQVIVAVGGGSAMDTAKGIRLMATHRGSIFDYDDLKNGADRIKPNMPPLVCIPTTAGTGSEVGRSTVITNEKTHLKVLIFSLHLVPTLSICDPELTLTLPPHITAATGIDALAHNIEAYLVPAYQPICDGAAREGIERIGAHLERAVKKGKTDLTARTEMMMGAMLGALAFQKGVGVCHALAHPLSTMAGTPHGVANGVFLARSMNFNKSKARAKLAVIARALGVGKHTEADSAAAAIDRVASLTAKIGLPLSLGELGIEKKLIPALSELAFKDAAHRTNPRPVTKAQLAKLYRNAL